MTAPTSATTTPKEMSSYLPLAVSDDTSIVSQAFNYSLRFIVDRISALAMGIYFAFRVVYDFLSIFGHLSITVVKLPLSLFADCDLSYSANGVVRHMILTVQYAASSVLFLSLGAAVPYGVRYLKHHYLNCTPTWTDLSDDRVSAYESAVALSNSAHETTDSLNKSFKALSTSAKIVDLSSYKETAEKALKLFSECEEASNALSDSPEKDQLIQEANGLLEIAKKLNTEVDKGAPPPPAGLDDDGDKAKGTESKSEGDPDEVEEEDGDEDIAPSDDSTSFPRTPINRFQKKKFVATLSPIKGGDTPSTPSSSSSLLLSPRHTPQEKALHAAKMELERLRRDLKKAKNETLKNSLAEAIEKQKKKIEELNMNYIETLKSNGS
jgi:hypothetical protein